METALSLINEMPSTLDQVARFVSKVLDEALSGNYNPLEVLIQLRAAKKAIDILNEDAELIEAALAIYDMYGEKVVDLNGVKVSKQEAAVKYHFEACNDKEWNDLKSAEEMTIDARKRREAFLKSLSAPLTVIQEETGDIATINPCYRTSKTVPVITLK